MTVHTAQQCDFSHIERSRRPSHEWVGVVDARSVSPVEENMVPKAAAVRRHGRKAQERAALVSIHDTARVSVVRGSGRSPTELVPEIDCN